MIEKIHKKLDKALTENLYPNEVIHIKLAGYSQKEALICTDRRVLIVKIGFLRGGGLSFNQFLYSKITSVDVKVGFLGAYFEIGLGGVQNQALSLYTETSKLPNCVTLISKKDAQKFRDACNFILQHIEEEVKPIQQLSVQASNQTASTTVEPKHEDIFEMIEKLAALKERNIITDEEFESKKMELLKRL
jgi:hypothetical protein